MKKEVVKKGCLYHSGTPKLTAAEEHVYILLTKEFLTRKQVCIRRQTSKQATDKIIRNIKLKGYLNSALKEVVKIQTTRQPNNQIRLHGQEFNINILYKDEKYKQILAKTNILNIDGNSIRLYKDSIEVYAGCSFFAYDVQKATAKSFEYWNRFFVRLEHDLKIIIQKNRCQNIKLVNSHYAETNNELSKDYEVKGDRLNIYTNEDGKLWFTIDNSFNLHEMETLHPTTSKPDMQEVKRIFNDIRDNKPPTLSEIMQLIKEMADINKEAGITNKETAAGLNSVVQLMKSNIPGTKHIESQDIKEKGARPEYVG